MTWTDMIDGIKSKLRSPRQRGGDGSARVVTRPDDTTVEDLRERPAVAPPVDVLESDRELVVRADMPSALPGRVFAYCDGAGYLVVSALPGEEVAGETAVREWEPVTWYRKLRLPESADQSRAKATFERGVLTVRIPKRKGFLPRMIPVRAH